MRVLVHRWDVRGPLPEAAIAEIQRAHRLRNALVEIERDHAEAVQGIWATHPEVARSEAALVAATELVEVQREALAAMKKAGLPSDLAVAAMKEARQDRKEAKVVQRAAKDAAYAAVKPLMVRAREVRKAAQKALYRTFVDQGLYWATYNAVRDHHETAVKQVAAKRKKGLPADLRFHRWEGEGTIAVQLQRQAGDPQRTMAALGGDTSKWHNVARLDGYPADPASLEKRDWRRLARNGEVSLTFRIGSKEHSDMVTVPVAVDRPVPPEADIVGLQVTRRLVGGKERASVAVTMRLPDVVPPIVGRRVALHLGWRRMADGSIRVAAVKGAPLPPPELVEAGVARHYGDWAEVRIPGSWQTWDEQLAGVAARRDQSHNVAKAGLAAWLGAQSNPPQVLGRDGEPRALLGADVERWRSPSRLARLTLDWRNDTTIDPAMMKWLEDWRRQDHHLWQWHAHATDRLAARRLDAWRKVAKWVCGGAIEVVVDEWGVPSLVKRGGMEAERDYAAEAVRRMARLAAPGLLRAQVVRAAGSVGAEVVVPAAGQPPVHLACGAEVPESVRHVTECPACRVAFDRDHERLLWMLATSAPVAA